MIAASLTLRVPKIGLFSASLPCEKVTQLHVTNYGTGAPNPLPDLTRVADVFVAGCKAGDILDVEAAFQATNNQSPHNVELTGKLIFTPSATATQGAIISHAGKGQGGLGMGFNITPDMHHGVLNLTGRYLVPFDCDGYVAAILYAGGDASLPNAWVPIDPCGHLNVTRYRN